MENPKHPDRQRQSWDEPQRKPSPENPPPGDSFASLVWDNVRSGATAFQTRQLPPSGHPIRQFFHGLSLPFHLHRALWANPAARRRYLKVGILQALVILALAFTFKNSTHKAVGVAADRVERREREEKQKKPNNFKLLFGNHKIEFEPDEPSAQDEDEDEDEQEPGTDAKAAPDTARPQEEAAMPEEARAAQEKAEAAAQKAQAKAEAVVQEAQKQIKAALEEAQAKQEAQAAREKQEAEEDSPLAQRFGIPNLDFWAALFAAVQIAQWVVIALSRDFHDSVSRDASLLTGLEPEDPPVPPRIRIDTKWLRNKLSRRIRAFSVFVVALPLLYCVSAFLPFRAHIVSVLISAWSAYWLVVFTTAKTAHAWRDTEAGPPWFLRGWNWLTTRVPGFRWGWLQGWGRFWENRTRSLYPPAAEMEKMPWAFAGLAVTRALSMIPLVKCFLRPLIPVAAAHLIVARRISEGASPAEASALPAPPSAPAPSPKD